MMVTRSPHVREIREGLAAQPKSGRSGRGERFGQRMTGFARMRDTHVRRGAEEATVGEVLGKHRETDLALTVRRPIGPEEVREIVGLTDDVYRNHWISYAYC